MEEQNAILNQECTVIIEKQQKKRTNIHPISSDWQEELINDPQYDKRFEVLDKCPPYSSIGLIKVQFQGKTHISYGTCFLIQNNLIMTAAHNLYNRPSKKIVLKAQFIPWLHLVNNSDSEAYTVRSVFIPQKFKIQKEMQQAYKHDYALLQLNTNERLAKTHAKFNIALYDIEIDQNAFIFGFPQDRNMLKNHNKNITTMFGCQGKITKTNQANIYHAIDTSVGQSGAPIFKIIKEGKYNKYQVIGIHSGGQLGSNFGVRINIEVYKKIQQWIRSFKLVHQEKLELDPQISFLSQNQPFSSQFSRIQRISESENDQSNIKNQNHFLLPAINNDSDKLKENNKCNHVHRGYHQLAYSQNEMLELVEQKIMNYKSQLQYHIMERIKNIKMAQHLIKRKKMFIATILSQIKIAKELGQLNIKKEEERQFDQQLIRKLRQQIVQQQKFIEKICNQKPILHLNNDLSQSIINKDIRKRSIDLLKRYDQSQINIVYDDNSSQSKAKSN